VLDCMPRRATALQVVEFVRGEEYARFSRIIFDTAPTGHTLRLLAVPDFVNASLGKIIRLRKRLAGASSALRGLFGASEQQDEAVAKLERMQVRPGPPPGTKRPAFQHDSHAVCALEQADSGCRVLAARLHKHLLRLIGI
jgi:anion-transporting  ArsA/GET3 family ATPase